MIQELFYVSHQSHGTLSIVLIGGGLISAAMGRLVLYLHWRGRHARLAARRVRSKHQCGRERRRR